ncbi:MAG TPA: selenoneine biosynthesis selenosugar synthase SenB [Xanthobacteraceae bacterium]|nr:selenoneine biosynthesis selenosugar synthase SenB [Xanthobacteraceae bacterium]
MKISLITPAAKRSRTGNRTTAYRWAGILRGLGHRVDVAVEYADEPADLMVALHAWRSAASIERFRALHPERPLLVALTGTDIYRFIHEHPEPTLRSLDLADGLIGLHELVPAAIPQRYHGKLSIIYQSAPPLPRRLPPVRQCFEVLVIANLREEKDPLRTAEAVRNLPETSRIRIVHYGGAHDQSWAERARAEMARNPRYIWRGEVPQGVVRKASARAPLMVLSSIMEGGANVISESIVAGVPVIASEIAGSVGLLGKKYAGYYPVGDTAALGRQLLRAEQEPVFLRELRRQCGARAPLFRPARERRSWRDLLARMR